MYVRDTSVSRYTHKNEDKISIFIVFKQQPMESDEGSKQKKTRDSMSSDSKLSKPIRVRPSSLQIDTINERLLDYNAYIVCCCGPILYFILYFL